MLWSDGEQCQYQNLQHGGRLEKNNYRILDLDPHVNYARLTSDRKSGEDSSEIFNQYSNKSFENDGMGFDIRSSRKFKKLKNITKESSEQTKKLLMMKQQLSKSDFLIKKQQELVNRSSIEKLGSDGQSNYLDFNVAHASLNKMLPSNENCDQVLMEDYVGVTQEKEAIALRNLESGDDAVNLNDCTNGASEEIIGSDPDRQYETRNNQNLKDFMNFIKKRKSTSGQGRKNSLKSGPTNGTRVNYIKSGLLQPKKSNSNIPGQPANSRRRNLKFVALEESPNKENTEYDLTLVSSRKVSKHISKTPEPHPNQSKFPLANRILENTGGHKSSRPDPNQNSERNAVLGNVLSSGKKRRLLEESREESGVKLTINKNDIVNLNTIKNKSLNFNGCRAIGRSKKGDGNLMKPKKLDFNMTMKAGGLFGPRSVNKQEFLTKDFPQLELSNKENVCVDGRLSETNQKKFDNGYIKDLSSKIITSNKNRISKNL